jgi:hypothetical protein
LRFLLNPVRPKVFIAKTPRLCRSKSWPSATEARGLSNFVFRGGYEGVLLESCNPSSRDRATSTIEQRLMVKIFEFPRRHHRREGRSEFRIRNLIDSLASRSLAFSGCPSISRLPKPLNSPTCPRRKLGLAVLPS